MSRSRVITGRDDRGYPVGRWSNEPVAAAPYGFMEPAFEPVITRRKATPAEVAASIARDMEKGYLPAFVPIVERLVDDLQIILDAHPIVVEVARAHMVSVAEMLSPSRRDKLVDARSDAAKRLYAETPMSYRLVGKELNRDGATVRGMLRRPVPA